MDLFIYLIIIIFFCFVCCIKWTKQDIADYYCISRKTLGKWVEYCSPKIDYEKWVKIRKLNFFDVIFIYDEFGMIEENKPLTKGQIKEKCETFYHTIRQNVALNFKKLGISKIAFSRLDVFPPKLSTKMIELMG